MKKFAETVIKNDGGFFAVHKNGKTTYEIQGLTSSPLIIFGGWVSPEDHQAEIGKIELQNLKYREEIARMQKSLRKKNKAIKELNGAVKKNKERLKECEALRIEANNEAAKEYALKCEVVEERAEFKREIEKLKSQLEKQQPEIPEFVAGFIENNLDQSKNLQDLYDEPLFHTGEIYLSGDEYDFISWFNENTTLFEKAWTNGYTVKEKRFYLKHIDMSKKYNSTVCVLAHGEGDVIYGHYEFPVGVFPSESDYIFTQSQIDSMETGSYEQFEVEE